MLQEVLNRPELDERLISEITGLVDNFGNLIVKNRHNDEAVCLEPASFQI